VSEMKENKWTARRGSALLVVVALAVAAVMILSAGVSSASAAGASGGAANGSLGKIAPGYAAIELAKSKAKHFTVGQGPNRAA
jgi:hypothetical protein